jgi:1-deoxy-D-xylulose-5-phosphate reductoisomerase
MERGQGLPVVLNAANEVAVSRFLDGRIAFTSIPLVIEQTMSAHRPADTSTLAEVRKLDEWARRYSQGIARELELTA